MAQLIRGTMLPQQMQERILLMDNFGKRVEVYLSLTAGPSRADKINSTLAAMTEIENTITTYAAANGHDMTADLASGAAAIAAEIATPTT